jgi:hypothetical protein
MDHKYLLKSLEIVAEQLEEEKLRAMVGTVHEAIDVIKKSDGIVDEILSIALNNFGGTIPIEEFDENDPSPDSLSAHNSTMIVIRCLKLLNRKEY